MFFKKFPKKLYNFDFAANSTVMVTDVLARVRFRSNIINNVSVYYKYQLEEGDTPEIVSHKVYGDSEYHWVIMLINEIKDPQFDFPLNINALEELIIKKYGYTGNTHGEKIAQAYSNVHHYIRETTKTLLEVDGLTTVNVSNAIVTLDQYSYKTNTLVYQAPNNDIVYPHNASNTIYFKANNSGQNTSDPTNVVSTLRMVEEYKSISVYDYEVGENEKKRHIKILRSEYIQPLVNEFEKMLSRGGRL